MGENATSRLREEIERLAQTSASRSGAEAGKPTPALAVVD